MHLNTQLNTIIPKIFFCNPRYSKPRQTIMIISISHSYQVPTGHPNKSVPLISAPIMKTATKIAKTTSTNVRTLDRVKILMLQLPDNFFFNSWSDMMKMWTRRATVEDWWWWLLMDILVRNRCFMVIFPRTFENNARCAVRWERRRGC